MIEQRIAAIEAEFDEPAWDVLAGFADMGYNRTDVAMILDLDSARFTRDYLPHVDPDRLIAWPGPPEGERPPPVKIGGHWYSRWEVAQIAGTSENAVNKRIRAGWAGRDLLAPAVTDGRPGRAA